MAKNIAVSNDVYELLTKVKLPGESFSDVIRRQFKQGARLSDIRGSSIISKQDWLKIRKTIRGSELITQKKLEKMYH
jgi:predicted CopG family antitoxin